MSLLNRFGFIVFNETGPEVEDLMNLPDGDVFAPAGASVILVPGETYSAYLAIDDALTFENTQIDLVTDSEKDLLNAQIGEITQIATSLDSSHYTISFGLANNTVLPQVYYRLRLNLASDVKLYSNRIWVRNSGYESASALFSFRNSRGIGPVAYDLAALNDFRNILRLKCYMELPKTDTNVEEYELVTTGVKRMVEGRSHVYVPFKTPSTDPIGREGWRTLLLHKDLLINNKPYSLKTGYSEGQGNVRLSDGSFEVWESSYSVINRC